MPRGSAVKTRRPDERSYLSVIECHQKNQGVLTPSIMVIVRGLAQERCRQIERHLPTTRHVWPNPLRVSSAIHGCRRASPAIGERSRNGLGNVRAIQTQTNRWSKKGGVGDSVRTVTA